MSGREIEVTLAAFTVSKVMTIVMNFIIFQLDVGKWETKMKYSVLEFQ